MAKISKKEQERHEVRTLNKRKYDIVLVAKYGNSGLTKEDAEMLFDMLGNKEGYPVEILLPDAADAGEALMMGFITPNAAERCHFSYDGTNSLLGRFLTNNYGYKKKEYDFDGLSIYTETEY